MYVSLSVNVHFEMRLTKILVEKFYVRNSFNKNIKAS